MPDLMQTLRSAQQLHQAGQWHEAEAMYQRIFTENPGFTPAIYCLGLLHYDQGFYASAIDHLERCVRGDGSRAAYHADLAQAYRAVGRTTDAAASYARAIELKPQFAQAHNNLGNIYRDLGQLDRAADCYALALQCNPGLAEAHNNLGTIRKDQGQVEEAFACYRRAIALAPSYSSAHFNLGLALQEQFRLTEAADAYFEALRHDPHSAMLHYHLALVYDEQMRISEAQTAYERAVECDPDYAPAYNNLGVILQDKGQLAGARKHYLRAMAADPQFAEAPYNLGTLDDLEGQWADAEAHYRQALAIKPDYVQARLNLGQSLSKQGRFDDVLACMETILATNPEHPEARYNRALVWLRKGHFVEGWKDYEYRWQCPEFEKCSFEQPEWDGSELGDKTILIHAEQGLGDTFQFVRYLPWISERGGRLLVKVAPALVRFLSQSGLPGQFTASIEKMPPPDVRIPLMSLPRVFGSSIDTIPRDVPYLRADADLVRSWRERIHAIDGFKVGIGWQGSPDYSDDATRSIPLVHFGHLAKVPSVQLISLQRHVGLDQLDDLRGAFNVITLGEDFDRTAGPFMDTAAVIQSLDLVITSDTALTHFAGALGVPVWVALSSLPEWRFLEHLEESPWYPTMRLFRQSRPGDWSEVFERIAVELAARVRAIRLA